MRFFCSAFLALLTLSTFARDLYKADLAKLLDPKQRRAEVMRLSDLSEKTYKLDRYAFFPLPQAQGAEPLYLLAVESSFKSSYLSTFDNYESDDNKALFLKPSDLPKTVETTPRLVPITSSTIKIFDHSGNEIRPFGGDNYASKDYFFDFNKDGIIERAAAENYSIDGADDQLISIFELKTIEHEPKTILQLIFNWHPENADNLTRWDYTCFDDDQDGTVEIGFGPVLAANEKDRRLFVLRWSNEAKRYLPDGNEKCPHVYVLESGESPETIAKAGGLDYPVSFNTNDPFQPNSEERSAKHPTPSPYKFQSLSGADPVTFKSFFSGLRNEDDWRGSPDAPDTALPDGFWDMDPKDAALGFAEINRTAFHKKAFRLAIDDRNNITPPGSGWIIFDWSSSGCYSFSTSLTAMSFGIESPLLISLEYNQLGAVGGNAWADRPAYQLRIFHLPENEAKFIANTIFWLNRVRSYSPAGIEAYSHRSSTADGHAECQFINGNGELGIEIEGTVWAMTPVADRWEASYNPTVCINLVDYLLNEGVIPRHNAQASGDNTLERHSLSTSLEERLARSTDQSHRKSLAMNISRLLALHEIEPLPAPLLVELVNAAHSECLIILIPELEHLLADLKPMHPDKELEQLKKRLGYPIPIDDPLVTEQTLEEIEEEIIQRARLYKLEKKRQLIAAHALREPLETAITKLRLATDPLKLEKAVRSDRDNTLWELAQLQRINPETWSKILISQFRSAPNQGLKAQIFDTLCAGTPAKAISLADTFNEADREQFLIPITKLHQKHAPRRLRDDIPMLMALLSNRDGPIYDRMEAMEILSNWPDNDDIRVELIDILLNEIDAPQKDSYSDTLSNAIRALGNLPNTKEHLEIIASIKDHDDDTFNACCSVIDRHAESKTERNRLLGKLVRHRFTDADGCLDSLFFTCLAFDLHEFAPRIATLATQSSQIPDGDLALSSQLGKAMNEAAINNQRYHSAREITALLNESDTMTQCKIWVAMACSRPYHFSPNNDDRIAYPKQLREKLESKLNLLSVDERKKVMTETLSLFPDENYYSDVKTWLESIYKE